MRRASSTVSPEILEYRGSVSPIESSETEWRSLGLGNPCQVAWWSLRPLQFAEKASENEGVAGSRGERLDPHHPHRSVNVFVGARPGSLISQIAHGRNPAYLHPEPNRPAR